MPSQHFFGICKGGPHDGKHMAHWAQTKTFYAPMVALGGAGLLAVANERVVPIVIGEYRLNDYHMWVWWETKDGAAYTQLSRHE